MRKLAFFLISTLISSGGFYGTSAASDPDITQEEWFMEAKNACKATLPELKQQLETFLKDGKILSNFNVLSAQKNYEEMMKCMEARERMLALEPDAQKNLIIISDKIMSILRRAPNLNWNWDRVLGLFGIEQEYNDIKSNIGLFCDAAEALNTQFLSYRPSEEEIKVRNNIPPLLRALTPTEGEVVVKKAKETLQPLLPKLKTNIESWEKDRTRALRCEEYIEKKKYQEVLGLIEAEAKADALVPLIQEQVDTFRQTYLTVREKFPKLTVDKLVDLVEVKKDFKEIKLNLGIFLHVSYKKKDSIPVKDEAQVDITKDDLFIKVQKACHEVLPPLELNLTNWLKEHKAHMRFGTEVRKEMLRKLEIVEPTKKLCKILFNNLLVVNESYPTLLEDEINDLLGIKEAYDRITPTLNGFLYYSK